VPGCSIRLAANGTKPGETEREANSPVALRRAPFITDGGNYILDCAFGRIESANMLQRELDGVVGVIEHRLFIGMASLVLISEGVKRLDQKRS
jgi:ribose 5-phosphate isomerase